MERKDPKFKADVSYSEMRLSMERSQRLVLEEDRENQKVSVRTIEDVKSINN